jgi:hypothetical protein
MTAVWCDARWIEGHTLVPEWPVLAGRQRVVSAEQAEDALRHLGDEVERQRWRADRLAELLRDTLQEHVNTLASQPPTRKVDMITLTMTFGSLEELAQFLPNVQTKDAAQPTAAPAPSAPTAAAETKRGPGRPPKAPAASEPSPETSSASQAPAADMTHAQSLASAGILTGQIKESAATVPVTPTAAATYAQSGIGEMIQQLVARDRAAAVSLLKQFGVARGPEIPPERFDEFKAAIGALLEPALG